MGNKPGWLAPTPFRKVTCSAWGRSKSSPHWTMLPPPLPPNATATPRRQTGKAGLPATRRQHPQHKHQAGTRVRLAQQFPAPVRCRKAGPHRRQRRPRRVVGERHHRRPQRLHRLHHRRNRPRQAGDRLHPLPRRRQLRVGACRRLLQTPADLRHGARPHKRRSRLRPTGQARLRLPRHLPQTISGASSRNPTWSIGRGAALAARHNRLRLLSRLRLLRHLPLRWLLRHLHRLRLHRQRR